MPIKRRIPSQNPQAPTNHGGTHQGTPTHGNGQNQSLPRVNRDQGLPLPPRTPMRNGQGTQQGQQHRMPTPNNNSPRRQGQSAHPQNRNTREPQGSMPMPQSSRNPQQRQGGSPRGVDSNGVPMQRRSTEQNPNNAPQQGGNRGNAQPRGTMNGRNMNPRPAQGMSPSHERQMQGNEQHPHGQRPSVPQHNGRLMSNTQGNRHQQRKQNRPVPDFVQSPEAPLSEWPDGVRRPPQKYDDPMKIAEEEANLEDALVQRHSRKRNRPVVHQYDSSEYYNETQDSDDGSTDSRAPKSNRNTTQRGAGKQSRGRKPKRSQQDNENRPSRPRRIDPRSPEMNSRDEYGRPLYNMDGYAIQWYPGYSGTDYPKRLVNDNGFPCGPTITIRNIKTGKAVRMTGLSYEDLPSATQKKVDEEPYDSAGALRIFYKSSNGMLVEYGSSEAAEKEKTSVRAMLDKIRSTDAGIGYNKRPQKDKGAEYLTDNRREDGYDNAKPTPGQYTV